MKRRILKKFVKAYRPYGDDHYGIHLGMEEEGNCRYWHGGHLRWWTHEMHKQKKSVKSVKSDVKENIEK